MKTLLGLVAALVLGSAAATLSGCSVGMALHGKPEPNLGAL